MDALAGLFISCVLMYVYLVVVSDFIESYEKYASKDSRLCKEMNCCYDPSWDAVVCKDWRSQINFGGEPRTEEAE